MKKVCILAVLLLVSFAACSQKQSVTDYIGSYIKQDNETDYMEIKKDGTFYCLDDARTFSGTYKVDGNTLVLIIPDQGYATGQIEPGKIIDNDGQVWIKATGE